MLVIRCFCNVRGKKKENYAKKLRKDSDYFGAIKVSIIINDPGLIKLVSV